VGDGVRRPHLERCARQLGIHDRCHFLGHRRDGGAILARAALSVSSSHAEGISNAILEAMASRRPVVATAVGGSPEIVREGVSGFLVPPGAPAALARRILDLLADPSLRARLGAEGRAIVEHEFSLAQMRTSYDALYEELIGLKVPRVMYGAA
jgi:glycosyltransferase involved in cell wall biosynthesis